MQVAGYTIAPEHLVMLGLFLGVLIAFEGLRQILSGEGRDEEARLRRMRVIREGRTPEEALQLLRAPEVKTGLARVPVIGDLPHQLRQAGIAVPPRLFLLGTAVAVVVAQFVFSGLFGPVLATLFALSIGAGLPVLLVRHLRRRRLDAFTAQLPDALDLMMRGLRVGHPLNVTFSNVAAMMEEPLAGEFAIMADQIAYGDELTDALYDLAERVDTEDVHYLAVSVSIQHGTGGNLAAMLGTLAATVRERIMMRRRVKALSSEGRMSAMMLSAMPILIYVVTSFTAPRYYGSVRDDPLFVPIALVVIALVVANYLVLRHLVNFKV